MKYEGYVRWDDCKIKEGRLWRECDGTQWWKNEVSEHRHAETFLPQECEILQSSEAIHGPIVIELILGAQRHDRHVEFRGNKANFSSISLLKAISRYDTESPLHTPKLTHRSVDGKCVFDYCTGLQISRWHFFMHQPIYYCPQNYNVANNRHISKRWHCLKLMSHCCCKNTHRKTPYLESWHML